MHPHTEIFRRFGSMRNSPATGQPQNDSLRGLGSKPESCVLLFLGCERSGTTFVAQTLKEFYPVSPGNESSWVIPAWQKSRNLDLTKKSAQLSFLRWVFSDWYFANKANYHGVYFDYKKFVQPGSFHFGVFVEEVFRHIANVEQNQWVLNKTCMYCEHMSIVDEVFNQPRVIHIVRDGRDVGLSLIKVKAWGPVSPYGAAQWWSKRVGKMQDYAAQHMHGRYLEINYEDLLENTAEVFERITKFYNIHNEERHSKLVDAIEVKSANFEKWRTEFTRKEVEIFERVAGQTLVFNGYELANKDLRPLSGWQHLFRKVHETVFSRIGFYPLWFRGLRIVNRLIGLSPELQQKFYRSELFHNHFNWNKRMKIRGKD